MPKKDFDMWVSEGKVQKIANACRAHILGPDQSPYNEYWNIGQDISQEAYDQLKDSAGDIYVLYVYEAGERKFSVIPRVTWEQAIRDLFDAPAPTSFEGHFDYYRKKLLSSDFDAQAVAALAINTLWRGFNAAYPDLESFRDADEAEQSEYLRKMSDMIKKMASDELMGKTPEGTSRGAALVHLYLIAVARNDLRMVNRIADLLEPFNKMAHDMTSRHET
ncbi:MAG: hypothetical protein WD688_08885 [Candidatus Binatia bacterium]